MRSGPLTAADAATGVRSTKRALTTLPADIDVEWNEIVEAVRPVGAPGGLRDLRNLWRASRGKDVLILRGSVALADRYRDLVLAVLVKLHRRRPRVLLTDCTWEVRSAALERRFGRLAGLVPVIARTAVRLIDGPHVRYGVLSSDELRTFPRTWGVPPDRVVRTGFQHTLNGGGEQMPVSDGGYLFAGGNSMRDHDLLAEAIEGATYDVVVAADWVPRRVLPNLVAGPVPHAEFLRLLAGSRAVVVPLARSIRSAGQQTYLNAMALGKPCVVTDAPGVRDFIEDGVNALIAAPDAASLRARLDEVMAGGPETRRMGERAREDVLAHHTEFTYRRDLLRLAGLPVPATATRADATDEVAL
jgi:hypothetical protein